MGLSPASALPAKILRPDPKIAPGWENAQRRLSQAAARQDQALLQAVARAEQRQAQMLEILRDRAWQIFAAAGCPRCRAHLVLPLDRAKRARLLFHGRLIAALFRTKLCQACGHAW